MTFHIHSEGKKKEQFVFILKQLAPQCGVATKQWVVDTIHGYGLIETTNAGVCCWDAPKRNGQAENMNWFIKETGHLTLLLSQILAAMSRFFKK